MKNKRKYARSSQRETSIQSKNHKQTNKNKKAQHSVSVIYDSGRNSLSVASPRPSKIMEKYKTYIQFITNNKISNDSFNLTKEEIAAIKKNAGTPVPRKNSPIPYSKGRRSAFSKLTQPSSPSNLIVTQRNSFAKSQPHQSKNQAKPAMCFVVRGSNVQNKSNVGKQDKDKYNFSVEPNKQASHKRKLSKGQENYFQLNNNKNSKATAVNQKRNGQKNNSQKHKQNKNIQTKNLKKESIQSQYNDKLQKQQLKLCQKLFQGIQFYRDLGRGAHALVRSAVDWNNKRKIAVKIYEKSELTQQQVGSIERQIQILMSLDHPNIIKLYEIIETFKTINLMMEYGGGNSLDQYIKSKPENHLNERQAKLIFKQILDAVKYLHEKNITHRDIKAENILLNKHLSLKIIDFGFSLVVSQANKNISSYCGTPTYMAPEVVSKTPHNPQLADRWSLGVLLFYMLNGHCPYRATTQKQLFAKINKGEYEYSQDVQPLAKDLVSKLMTKNPTQRLSPKLALEHLWFQKN